MIRDPTHAAEPAETDRSLVVLALLALVVGAAAGLVGAIFRLALEQADGWRDALIARARVGMLTAGFLLVATTCAVATSIAA
jgi:CIC family chloride channel protein